MLILEDIYKSQIQDYNILEAYVKTPYVLEIMYEDGVKTYKYESESLMLSDMSRIKKEKNKILYG